MPTATWFTGQTSAAAGGAGFGTGAYTTTNNSYPTPTAGALLCVWIVGLTNNAGTLTGGAFSSSVGTGTNPTFSQHTAGWLSGTGAGGNWVPFCTMFYVNPLPTCTNLRFICDATDSIYQWFVVWTEYASFDSTNPFGRWGSDTAVGDTLDNEVTDLDQNTGFGNVAANSHTVGEFCYDGSAGAIAPGSGFVERYEGPSGSGQTGAHFEDNQTPSANTVTWGAVTPTTGEWITFGVEIRHTAGGAAVGPPFTRRRRSGLLVR